MKEQLEAPHERWCVTWAENNSWTQFKIARSDRRGVPDRWFGKGGRCVFVEFKRPDGEGRLSEPQKRRIRELQRNGFEAYVNVSKEDFIAILEGRRAVPDPDTLRVSRHAV